jgi:tRNA (cytidine/uridine-2'-O-)-methyltransferase
MPLVHIVLWNPEIPGNTGNVGRLAVGIGAHLHLVHPLGFSTAEKEVRRAGIDHWNRVELSEHESPETFWQWARGRVVHCYSARAEKPFTQVEHREGDVLVFGCESVGLPGEVLEGRGAWGIPMEGPVRSLNLANAVSVVAYEAVRQLRPALFGV